MNPNTIISLADVQNVEPQDISAMNTTQESEKWLQDTRSLMFRKPK
jgi:hypothetical protein